MIGFILGISITVNIVLVIAIIIYLNVKKNLFNFDFKKYDSLDDSIVDIKESEKFLNDDIVDFSSLLRK